MESKAFTLIELLVVTFIIGILSAIVALNYRVGGEQLKLHRSAYKLAQDIRKAGEMAMSTKEFQGSVPPGYGIYLDAGNPNYCDGNEPICYILYADTQPPQGNEFYNPADDEVEIIYLEKGVKIEAISTPNNKIGINYKPPNPQIKIRYTLADEIQLLAITLSLESDPTKTKIIRVNIAGLVNVE